MAKEKPLTDERKELLLEACVRIINQCAGESQVEVAELLRHFLGTMLYRNYETLMALDIRAASDPLVLAMVTEALRRGGVLG
jgi:hypothetical protein